MKSEKTLRTPNEQFPGTIQKCIQEADNQFLFTCDKRVALRVTVMTDRIIRFRYSTNGIFPNDFSYALDTAFQPEIPQIEFKEKDDHFRITTARVICRISKEGFLVNMLDKSGTVILADEKGFHWEPNNEFGGDIVQMSKYLQGREYFYGLGDKSGRPNMRKRKYSIWGTDSYGYSQDTDPLYKNIPFYYGVHSGIGYGLFFDNSFRSYFDFGKERDNVTSFWADGGEMNYYFIYGPDLLGVAEQFHDITGRPELPPLWTLAYHQCKWSYYPEAKVHEIANGFRDRQIPCDAIYLDIDYMDGFRCFTWDLEKFPNPKGMVDELRSKGFKTVVMIDPGLKVDPDYWVTKEGLEKDMFCRRGDGPYLVAPVWPGDCYFPDFTRPDVREWWADLYKGLIAEIGVDGVWNDMNEPAIFLADNFTQSDKTFYNDVRHDYDGNPCSHRKAHNVYGMQMTRATHMGLKKHAPDKRPFVITRSSYAGAQRYTSGWTGDNVASWEHLWIANVQCQRVSISGMSFIGSDIGGFIDSPDGELYLRWLQMAVFHPFMRTHSSGDHGDQEPWSFGDKYTDLCKRVIEFRYRILPYIYTTFWQHVQTGRPMIRPLAFLDQSDRETLHRMEEFGFGESLLICPISKPGVEGRWMYLPNGEWFDFWTNKKMTSHTEFWAEVELDQIPLFVRAGAIIPTYPVQQFVGEIEKPQITLQTYYINGEYESQVYLDAGDGYGYEKEEFSLRKLKTTGDENTFTIHQEIEGEFKGLCKDFVMNLHGFPTAIDSITVDGKKVKVKSISQNEKEMSMFKVGRDFSEINIVLKG